MITFDFLLFNIRIQKMNRTFKINTNEGYSYNVDINQKTYLVIISSNDENKRYERVLNKTITDRLDQDTKISSWSRIDYLDLTFNIELNGIYAMATVTIPYVGSKL